MLTLATITDPITLESVSPSWTSTVLEQTVRPQGDSPTQRATRYRWCSGEKWTQKRQEGGPAPRVHSLGVLRFLGEERIQGETGFLSFTTCGRRCNRHGHSRLLVLRLCRLYCYQQLSLLSVVPLYLTLTFYFFNALVFKVDLSWRRKWQPTPVFLPVQSHGQRSLAGHSPWGHKESTKLRDWTLL